jgi:hypothetical protein
MGSRVVAVLALWLLRRSMPAVSIPIRVALFLLRVVPVSVWLLRYADRLWPVAQPAPSRSLGQRRSRRLLLERSAASPRM